MPNQPGKRMTEAKAKRLIKALTECLECVDLEAARHRLGETHWTFPRRLTGALEALAALNPGYVHRAPAVFDARQRRRRYGQCDVTCTVDCGHCKGQGRPQ